MIEKELEIINNKLTEIIKDNSPIYVDISEFLSGTSKRIRSKLAILYLKANDKDLNSDIYNLLTAGELVHNASLLHDDIVDNNSMRRGITTIGKKYSQKMSILVGDYVLSFAIKELQLLNNAEVLNSFINCAQRMAQAEITQLINRGNKPTENEYIKICCGKTARLFEAILEGCALISDLPHEDAKSLGKAFGILFQIKNDILPESRENDKQNKVYTAYDIFGVEKTRILMDNYKEEVLEIVSKFPNTKYVNEIEGIVNSL